MPGSAPDSSKGAPTDPDAPISGIRSSGLRFCYPLLSATVALTRLLMTLSSSRVSQWQFRKPTPPLATHRLPRVGFPAFRRYDEGATTSSVHFEGLIAFGHRYLLRVLESGKSGGSRRLRVIFPGQKRAHSGYSETTHCFGSSSQFQKRFRLLELPLAEIRPEFDTLQMQACCNQECRA